MVDQQGLHEPGDGPQHDGMRPHLPPVAAHQGHVGVHEVGLVALEDVQLQVGVVLRHGEADGAGGRGEGRGHVRALHGSFG